MTPKRKRRLLFMFSLLAAASLAVALLLVALGSNMNHYYELSDLPKDNSLRDKTIRIGGLVEKGSIKRQAGNLTVNFVITNLEDRIHVTYTGVLPDLFKDGQGVLAKGRLVDHKTFVAEQILAKHDENYMPKEVREALEKRGYFQHYDNKLPTQ